MKTINTVIISALLAVSMSATAVEFEIQTEKMNQVLQSQIDEKVNQKLSSLDSKKSESVVDVRDQRKVVGLHRTCLLCRGRGWSQ